MKFFYGMASGQSKKALREIGEPNRMLSFETYNNSPPDDEDLENLFIDCGGYSVIKTGSYKYPAEDYVAYLKRVQPDLFALRDYPGDRQRTIEKHRKVIDLLYQTDGALNSDPVCILQGRQEKDLPEKRGAWQDYVEHIDQLRDAGVLSQYVGIGGLKPRDAPKVRDIIIKVRENLPQKHDIHVFGASSKLLRYPRVINIADSMDSQVYEHRRQKREEKETWKQSAIHYLRFRQEVEDAIEGDLGHPESQRSLSTFNQ